MELFGFIERATLEMFTLLISVSGIGPRGALGILNVGSVHILESAIASGDTSFLTKISGIGRKTAEKIVLELRDKMVAIGHDTGGTEHRGDMDVHEALKSLGYGAQEIRDVMKDMDQSITDTGTKIKEALKLLGKQ
jgi:Holliday junction DNA helicase RuvA